MGKVATDQEESLINAFFDQVVFCFMKHDLEIAIAGGANFLAAQGLAADCEILGGLLRGTIQEKRGNQDKFEVFLPYLGNPYVVLDAQLKTDPRYSGGLYEVVRCGLVHEYLMKEPGGIYRHGPHAAAGIFRETGTGRLIVVLRRFLDDLMDAAARVRDAIIVSPDPRTLAYMRQWMSNLAPAPASPVPWGVQVTPGTRAISGPPTNVSGGTYTDPGKY